MENSINRWVALFESWYVGLPLAVRLLGRLLGDIVCLDVTIYLVALVAASLGLFGLISPNTWALSTWEYILAASVALCVSYELLAMMIQKY